MRRGASSRTVSTSTDSSLSAARDLDGTSTPSPRPRKTPPYVVTRLAAAWRKTSAWVSHFLTTPVWRRVKLLADVVLLVAVFGALGWAATNGVFVANRAADDRAQALVHLGGLPTVTLTEIGSKRPLSDVPPTIVLSGIHSDRISIALTNDGTDGVTVQSAMLSGPFFPRAMKLVPNHPVGAYIGGQGTSILVATVTVDCDAAAPVAQALVAGEPGSPEPPTTLKLSAKDTNGTAHSVLLTIDTTAFAIQGRVCTQ
jgi:hypothetical protein